MWPTRESGVDEPGEVWRYGTVAAGSINTQRQASGADVPFPGTKAQKDPLEGNSATQRGMAAHSHAHLWHTRTSAAPAFSSDMLLQEDCEINIRHRDDDDYPPHPLPHRFVRVELRASPAHESACQLSEREASSVEISRRGRMGTSASH